MPGTQPRGTHSFDPSHSSAQSAQMLDTVNAEVDEAEDQGGPLLDTPLADIADIADASTSFSLGLDVLGKPSVPGLPSKFPSSLPLDFSSSGGTGPPSSSSIPPMAHSQRRDISMGSAFSDSDPGNAQHRKRKHDGQSAGGTRPPSSKRSARGRTSDVNPVIISTALNSTLNRLVDVMVKSLDATAPTIAPPTTNATPPTSESPILASSSLAIESQTTPSQPSSNQQSARESPQEILNKAMKVATSDITLSEDELLAASLFFTSATEEAVRVANTLISLNGNPAVQRLFLLRQHSVAALLPGKGKGKAVEEGDDSMTY